MRRVNWVRIVVIDGQTQYEAVGMGNRLPATCRICCKTASALAARGVPVLIRSCEGQPGLVSSVG